MMKMMKSGPGLRRILSDIVTKMRKADGENGPGEKRLLLKMMM